MSKQINECKYEEDVLTNLESGDIKPQIKAHMDSCSICTETASVFGFMNRFRDLSVETFEKKLPSADTIWQGAFANPLPIRRVVNQPDEELVRKAMLPMMITQILTYIVIAAGIGYLVFTNFSQIAQIFNINIGAGTLVNGVSKVVEKSSKISLIYLIPPVVALVSIIVFMVTSEHKPDEKVPA